jgi:MraZ protein
VGRKGKSSQKGGKETVLNSGVYDNTLDDKGRVSIPARLREIFGSGSFVVTKGGVDSLMLYTPQAWKRFEAQIRATAKTLPAQKANALLHSFIIPAQELEIDKTGRIAIPSNLRAEAGLKKDCTFLVDGNQIGLWDKAKYDAYKAEMTAELEDVLQTVSIDFAMVDEQRQDD